jgi:5-methylcytosine-specific restriction endonuclease McrBC GTP-binding regulatory subunit McrB
MFVYAAFARKFTFVFILVNQIQISFWNKNPKFSIKTKITPSNRIWTSDLWITVTLTTTVHRSTNWAIEGDMKTSWQQLQFKANLVTLTKSLILFPIDKTSTGQGV